MTTATVAAAETIPIFVREKTFSDDGAARVGERVGGAEVRMALLGGSNRVASGAIVAGDVEVDDVGAGDGAPRSGVEGINMKKGCGVGEAPDDAGFDGVGDGDGVAIAGADEGSLDVGCGVAGEVVGVNAVGAGVRASSPEDIPGVGEGVAGEPVSSIEAARSDPTCASVQDPVVQPTTSIVLLYPAATALAFSSAASDDPPCWRERRKDGIRLGNPGIKQGWC